MSRPPFPKPLGRPVDQVEHVAERPSWDCLVCGRPWPCDPARELLVIQYAGSSDLVIYMWTCLEEASSHLAGAPLGEMMDRFLRWTYGPIRRRGSGCADVP